MHRVITNAPKGMTVDHKDGNRLNNQRDNLRICTLRQNLQNRRVQQGSKNPNKTGLKGTYQTKNGHWFSAISIGTRRNKYLGRFSSAEAAARAYDAAALHYYGDFARLNFPESKCRITENLQAMVSV